MQIITKDPLLKPSQMFFPSYLANSQIGLLMITNLVTPQNWRTFLQNI
jgi:hypothetical protein